MDDIKERTGLKFEQLLRTTKGHKLTEMHLRPSPYRQREIDKKSKAAKESNANINYVTFVKQI